MKTTISEKFEPPPELQLAIRLSEEGYAAGLVGEPCDANRQEAWLSGWKRGVAKARVQRGEAIGYVGQGCRCGGCGVTRWGHRLGCCKGAALDYGVLVVMAGQTDDAPARFMNVDAVLQLGLELVDLVTGDAVPVSA